MNASTASGSERGAFKAFLGKSLPGYDLAEMRMDLRLVFRRA